MNQYKHRPMGLPVPDGRLSRLARLGGMAAGVAGNIAVNGGRQLASGQRPRMNDLLLTPANAARITSQLAQMRGAAMKMGQLLSMEGGDFIPPELAEILGHLRADAHYMPPAQLKKVLAANWGADFLKRFQKFDVRPIAAASIGQVHHAERLCEGVAIIAGGKVPYTGSVETARDRIPAQVRLETRSREGGWTAALPEETRREGDFFYFPLPETGIEPLLKSLIEGDAGILSLSIERAGLHDAFVAIAGEAAARQLEADPAGEAA